MPVTTGDVKLPVPAPLPPADAEALSRVVSNLASASRSLGINTVQGERVAKVAAELSEALGAKLRG